VRALAVVGNLSLDRVDGGEPRVGGAPFHAARALRVLGRPAIVAAKGADADRRLLLPPLVRLGLPVLWRGGDSTASFSFHYAGDLRSMVVDTLGPSWTAADLRGLERADWVHVGALARSDFPAETLAALAHDGRRLSFDGQGLVRPARTGPLAPDAEYDPEVLGHVSVLKLAEEEARILLGREPDADALRSLGVPEIVVTFGSTGSLVFAEGRLERVPARAVAGEIDPTGAGDAFTAAYLVSRSSGYAPVAAARRATALVAGLLGRRLS
jgi:sugar/nucleoside kinase (ribokinase family)